MARWLGCAAIVLLVMAFTSIPAVATGPVASSAAPAAPSPATGADSDETLLLDVQVNGHSIGKIGEFTLRHGLLMARPDELRALGFRVPVSNASATGGLIGLSDLPGVAWTLDVKNSGARSHSHR